MTLSAKLVTGFLGCGLLPLAIVAFVSHTTAQRGMNNITDNAGASLEQSVYNQLAALRDVKKAQVEKYFAERQGDMGVLVETVATVRRDALERLRANRDMKRGAVERYFQSIEDQILTFSEDRMIVDAMREFRDAFRAYRSEREWDAAAITSLKNELSSYYTDHFAPEYRKQNNGQAPPIDKFLAGLDQEAIALQHAYISANKHPLGSKHQLDAVTDGTAYSAQHGAVHPIVRNFLEKFGYYDIFLVDAQTGDIVYSVFKELDFGTSLVDGPYANTNFGEAFRAANAATEPGAVVLVDYKQYPPSYEAPASFIASPIFDGDKKIGVAMFQMPIDRLNAVMGERSGLGETGETYLIGPDLLMRSDSYLDPEYHSVIASFRNPSKGAVKTHAAQQAVNGETGADVVIDYNGNPVLSAYCPVKIGNLTWGLLAEIDVAEAFCPQDEQGTYFFKKYADQYGYYDLFLINPDGYCFYTVCQEADYQTNLVNGKYADSGLGELVRTVLKSKKFGFADFKPYAPSNGAPAAFVAQPVLGRNGAPQVVVALQLPLEGINGIMSIRSGMGETGETYLVGADKLMRSDSYLDPENHTVAASFANPTAGKVDTEAANAALNGETGARIINDYNGNPVLSAFGPLDVFGTRWALLAEIDESEALAAVSEMRASSAAASRGLLIWIGMIGAIAAVVVTLVSLTTAGSISRPINRIIASLNEGSAQVNDAATQVSTASQQLAEGASEQASSLEQTSSALEQMAAMTGTNAENAKQANTLSNQASEAASRGDQTMGKLNEAMSGIQESSEAISKIIKVIEEIAFQTNLLALNAAVEAARAGEHGKGFAVVADEVRNLALRAAEAAKETTGLIEDAANRSRQGVSVAEEVGKALGTIVTDVTKVTELITGIARASEEQSQGVDQINNAVSQMDKVTQQNAAGAEESASAAEQLSAQAQTVNGIVDELASIVRGTQKRG